ncbi:MAG: hypothetical protein QMD12_01230 [Candidatus Aenigmarchaeota archaeon]|nr:hypothetical protein [Candidatus Aenigmarchaeota archaeon]
MKLLTEEEINNDLRYTGRKIKLEMLVDKDNPYLARSKKKAVRGYTYGYHVREFLLENEIRMTLKVRELLPLAFVVQDVREIEHWYGAGSWEGVKRGLNSLQSMGIICFDDKYLHRKAVFYLNSFEKMRDGLAKYAYGKGIKSKEFKERFEKQLGSIKSEIDEISKDILSNIENIKSKENYRKF